MLLPCLAGREATGSQNLLKMMMLLGSRRGCLKFHKTYMCVSAEGSRVVTFIQAWRPWTWRGMAGIAGDWVEQCVIQAGYPRLYLFSHFASFLADINDKFLHFHF